MLTKKAAIIVHTYGCTFQSIPAYEHQYLYLLDSNSPLINNLALVPDYRLDFESAVRHINMYIDPKRFHAIHILRDYTDTASIKTAASLDSTASFLFIGSIPEVYRSILSGRTVRVATQFEDLTNIFDGLFQALIQSFTTYLHKEYASTGPSAEEISDTQYMNKYAERLFQSGKDIFKVIQTAAGPLQMPPMPFSRKSSQTSEKDEEVKKLVNEGLLALIFETNTAEVIWNRIQKYKTGLECTGELALLLNRKDQSVRLGKDQCSNVRILILAAQLHCPEKVDWSSLLKNYFSQSFACKLAVNLFENSPLSSRHFLAVKSLVVGAHSFDQRYRDESVAKTFDLSIIAHEYICLEAESTDRIIDIQSNDTSVLVKKWEQIAAKIFIKLETHIRASKSVELNVKTEFNNLKWHINFEVDENTSVYLRLYHRGDLCLAHFKANDLKAIEFSSYNGKSTVIRTTDIETEWLIHLHSISDLSYIELVKSNGRVLKWTNEHLKRVDFLLTNNQ